jgi:CheY-like chemotaxis protein
MPRVLLVEDDQQLRRQMAGTLKASGFVCEEAESGRVGLEKMCEATFRRTPFDCVLLDIIMPEVDGWEFLEAVHANPLWSRTRIVILSSRAVSARDVARATSMDCVHVEKKGHVLDMIGQMVTRMVAATP